jgi:hypothetical protein
VAIGKEAGNTSQGTTSIAIGNTAGKYKQGIGASGGTGGAIAIGNGAGTGTTLIGQNTNAIAIGTSSGSTAQGAESISIGSNSGQYRQGVGSGAGTGGAIAIGDNAGTGTTLIGQNSDAIAIGSDSGNVAQGIESIAIGNYAGNDTQSDYAVAIGSGAGETSQGQDCVAIGFSAGQTNQVAGAVAIGSGAGFLNQGNFSIAIGTEAGSSNQNTGCVALGYNAGVTSQGNNSVAIGALAGNTACGANSIILNGTGVNLSTTTTSGLFVKPIRQINRSTTNVLQYNTSTSEIVYDNLQAPLELTTASDYTNINTNTYYIGCTVQLSYGSLSGGAITLSPSTTINLLNGSNISIVEGVWFVQGWFNPYRTSGSPNTDEINIFVTNVNTTTVWTSFPNLRTKIIVNTQVGTGLDACISCSSIIWVTAATDLYLYGNVNYSGATAWAYKLGNLSATRIA